jgi:transposase
MKNLRFVGLDVHKDTVTIAVAEPGTSAPEVLAEVAHEVGAITRQLRKVGKASELRCCYEAGPTGTKLCRALRAKGYDCIIVAPSMVPQKPGDRVKTDRRDAIKLARFLRSGDLTDVYVLDAETEALRDLVRARDQAKRAENVARLQVRSFLLRHGRVWSGKGAWHDRHIAWVRGQQFEHEAHNRVIVALVQNLENARERVKQLTEDLEQLATTSSQAPLIKALQAMRGVQLITAAIIATEIGNFGRFPSAPAFGAFVGLVPSESSSGSTRRQGTITHAGNTYVRRALVEAAWAYRHRPAVTKRVRMRQEGVDSDVKRIAWKAQLRLTSRYRSMSARGKNKQLVITAVARELSGFVWAIARQQQATTV